MRLLAYGSRDYANVIRELISDCGHEFVGLIDDFNRGDEILGSFREVREKYQPSDYGIVMAIGYSDMEARWKAWQAILSGSYHAPALIHPNAYVARSASIQPGAVIMTGSVVDVRAKVGEAAVLWPMSCVNHDTKIGENVFISPGAVVCGFAEIGAHSFIGAGSVIVERSVLASGSRVKALERISLK